MRTASPRTSPSRSRPPAWATCWDATIPTGIRASTTPWSAWPRTSPCATCWWTATATSVPSTAIPPRPTVTPRPACPSWPTRCCGTLRRTPWIGTPTLTRPGRSPRCFPPGSQTCWSTAPAASPWAWPPTSRPTICGRSSMPSSACWMIRRLSSPT